MTPDISSLDILIGKLVLVSIDEYSSLSGDNLINYDRKEFGDNIKCGEIPQIEDIPIHIINKIYYS